MIPEFYSLPEFLLNLSNHDLGKLVTSERVHNVKLANFCDNNPYLFIANLKIALEKSKKIN